MYSSNELYHHGIKGMRWGVRRYQNPDGSLTKAGTRRYKDKSPYEVTTSDGDTFRVAKGSKNSYNTKLSKVTKTWGQHYREIDDAKAKKRISKQYAKEQAKGDEDGGPRKNPIQKHKDKLIQKYVEKGYSQNAAEVAANQRMRTELVVGAVAAVSVAVIAKKAATRIGQDYCDKIIKSGAEIQNIGSNSKATFKDSPFYAATNKSDKKAYGMLYANEKRGMAKASLGDAYEGIYNNKIKLTQDVKRVSVKNARKALYDKMDADSEFKKEVLNTIKSTAYGYDAENLFKSNPAKFYDRFNQALATPQFQSKGIHKKFYSELEKRGYNAILDINDTRYSGYKGVSKSPTIFFGDGKWEKIGSRQLSDTEIDNNVVKYTATLLAKKFGKEAVGIAAAIGVGKNVSDSQKINRYLDEHPNSKLSKKEILEAVRQEAYR